jgi:hypothetical protein
VVVCLVHPDVILTYLAFGQWNLQSISEGAFWWNETDGANPKYLEQNLLNATVSITNSTLTGMGMNPDLSGERLVTDHLCYNRKLSFFVFSSTQLWIVQKCAQLPRRDFKIWPWDHHLPRCAKVKLSCLQAWSGPEGSRKLKFSDYMTVVVRFSALCTGRLYPPGNAPGTHFC